MPSFRRTESDEQPKAPSGPLRRVHAVLMRRLLVGWLLGGAAVGTLGFLFLFDRHSPSAQLITGLAFGGLAVVCIAVLAIWLRIAMRRAGRDQA